MGPYALYKIGIPEIVLSRQHCSFFSSTSTLFHFVVINSYFSGLQNELHELRIVLQHYLNFLISKMEGEHRHLSRTGLENLFLARLLRVVVSVIRKTNFWFLRQQTPLRLKTSHLFLHLQDTG